MIIKNESVLGHYVNYNNVLTLDLVNHFKEVASKWLFEFCKNFISSADFSFVVDSLIELKNC